MLQFDNVIGEAVGAGFEVAPERTGSVHVGAGCPSKTEIHPAWEQGFQRAELLGYDEW